MADKYLILWKLLKQKKKGVLERMDIEKAFDSLDHNFLISTTGKYGFSEKFISCIKRKVVAKKQESCMFLMVVKLQSIFCLVETPVKVIQFQFY